MHILQEGTKCAIFNIFFQVSGIELFSIFFNVRYYKQTAGKVGLSGMKFKKKNQDFFVISLLDPSDFIVQKFSTQYYVADTPEKS